MSSCPPSPIPSTKAGSSSKPAACTKPRSSTSRFSPPSLRLCCLCAFALRKGDWAPRKELLMSIVRVLCRASLLLVAVSANAQEKLPRVAVVTTVWRHNSHADVLASRLVQGYTLDGQGDFPKLKLVAAYVDQFPENDMSRGLARQHGFTIYDSVAGALTLGTGQLAVDGVLLICEHGDYPRSNTGSIQYPKRRLFGEIIKVFETTGRVVPVFSDKHLEDDWTDIQWFYNQAQRFKIPLMAGSSLPTLWRYPEADVQRGRPLKEIVATSYGGFDAYGFHALEMVQCLAERR